MSINLSDSFHTYLCNKILDLHNFFQLSFLNFSGWGRNAATTPPTPSTRRPSLWKMAARGTGGGCSPLVSFSLSKSGLARIWSLWPSYSSSGRTRLVQLSLFIAVNYAENGRQGDRWRVLAIGQFFFVKIWPGSDLVSVAELQLLWEDKVSIIIGSAMQRNG
jgi:hypothetical protein